MKPLEYAIEKEGEITIFKLMKELDYLKVSEFDIRLNEISQDANKIILDISKLEYICSAALGSLLNHFNKARQNGKSIVLIGLNDKIANPFNAIGLTRLMYFADDINEAKTMIEEMENEK